MQLILLTKISVLDENGHEINNTKLRKLCSSNPCQNSGICHVKDGKEACLCPVSFSGSFCEVGEKPCQTCLNGGYCKFMNESVQCVSGWLHGFEL